MCHFQRINSAQTSKEDLVKFSWENIHKELKERALMFMRFIEASVQNPSQAKNVNKKDDNLIPPMCDAASQLISIFIIIIIINGLL